MNEEQSNQDKHVVVATKLSRPAAEQLARIAKRKGMTIYELIQMVCDTLIRYMDDRHNLSEEMERAISIFEHLTGWADALNLADPTVHKEVAQAVYIFQSSPDTPRKGFRAKMVSKPFMGIWEETSNVMDIFERIFNICMPELYMKLFRARIILGCERVSEVINLLSDAEVIMRLNGELRNEFEDAGRTESGKAIEYGNRTRRKKHLTPDDIQTHIVFDDDDREIADMEAQDWEGEHKGDSDDGLIDGARPFTEEY